MYKPYSINASLLVRVCTTFMEVKTEENCGGNYCLQAGALIRRLQICIDHPISVYLILRKIQWHCPTNYLLIQFSMPYFAIPVIFLDMF